MLAGIFARLATAFRWLSIIDLVPALQSAPSFKKEVGKIAIKFRGWASLTDNRAMS
jgi:hypothetical protein